MREETFRRFWDAWTNSWLNNATVTLPDGEKIRVSSLCSLKSSACEDVFQRYCEQKEAIKGKYFKNQTGSAGNSADIHLNRYKRAAVLTNAILLADPVIIDIINAKANTIKDNLEKQYPDLKMFDIFYVKQRLAFYLALGSIIQDFPESAILDIINSGKTVFQFDELGKGELLAGEDDFQMSIYKDLFFSEYYENFNVLTMANVYGLLTERCSNLPILKEQT